ncbi:hypothetical protein [Pseudophaeobacter flagellatus]|uniref:hypothetical protein n=1 Tax=Pseudophaeobacter flagellatus TaxID=2899119 RepID=UPI001E59D80E|nr:hypothetical protein [Pseudophaeobacter flagellatus]MCD9148940.1 hypothetical protein [Pseudophaeobacter flagellatus]
MNSRLAIARAAWGNTPPDWIFALVRACDAPGASQNKVAARLSVSAATVSQVLRNSYAGDTARIEARVRATFVDADVDCPAIGTISAESCMSWRDRSKRLGSAAPNVVRMFRACRACPKFKPGAEE